MTYHEILNEIGKYLIQIGFIISYIFLIIWIIFGTYMFIKGNFK
jgi:hypothetical protein